MEPIIRKAIQGGYHHWHLEDYLQNVKPFSHFSIHEFVCDPLFWEALGKACWWDSTKEYIEFDGFLWLKNALRFHEINLTEGWDKAIIYLSGVTK